MAQLPDSFPVDRIPERGKRALRGADWTDWIAVQLHEVARQRRLSCCCHFAPHSATLDSGERGQPRGYHLENLFDMTWYRDWSRYELPEVIIEHENEWRFKAFMRDHWKLMMGRAPLRVSFGYTRKRDGWKQLQKKLNGHATRNAWSFPATTEDLVLVGHGHMMTPHDYKVLHRGAGDRSWSTAGRLKSRKATSPTSS